MNDTPTTPDPRWDQLLRLAAVYSIPPEAITALAITYDDAREEYTADRRREAANLILWRAGDHRGTPPGEFMHKLYLIFGAADGGNEARLAAAFPELAIARQLMQEQGADALIGWAS